MLIIKYILYIMIFLWTSLLLKVHFLTFLISAMSNHIWLRAENEKTAPSRGNPNLLETERRTVLAPEDAAKLVKAGYKVTVEKSAHRIFHDTDYSAAGYEAGCCAWIETVY